MSIQCAKRTYLLFFLQFISVLTTNSYACIDHLSTNTIRITTVMPGTENNELIWKIITNHAEHP